MKDNMVPVTTFDDEFNAKMAKSKLEALGIEAILVKSEPDEEGRSVDLDTTTSVFVRSEDLVVASEILEETSGDRDLFPNKDI